MPDVDVGNAGPAGLEPCAVCPDTLLDEFLATCVSAEGEVGEASGQAGTRVEVQLLDEKDTNSKPE